MLIRGYNGLTYQKRGHDQDCGGLRKPVFGFSRPFLLLPPLSEHSGCR